jgi:hypothetical protein
MPSRLKRAFLALLLLALTGCAGSMEIYRDPNMDFGSVHSVAIMPFNNLTRESAAAERVRDIFTTKLLATGALYVIPPGEVARGVARVGVNNPVAPSSEELIKMAGVIKADAIITGTVREYGELRSGTAAANVISLSVQMIEAQTGRVVWSASTTKGGIGISDRLFGGGGEPMNDITEKAVNDIIKKLFQ